MTGDRSPSSMFPSEMEIELRRINERLPKLRAGTDTATVAYCRRQERRAAALGQALNASRRVAQRVQETDRGIL